MGVVRLPAEHYRANAFGRAVRGLSLWFESGSSYHCLHDYWQVEGQLNRVDCILYPKASSEVGLSQFVGEAGRGQTSGVAPACLADLYVI